MDFEDLVKRRQSVRRYSDRPVDRVVLERLVEAFRLSPSACNAQPWKLILVDDPELKQQVARATFGPAHSLNTFALETPVIAAIVMERTRIITQFAGWLKKREYPLIDIGIAVENFCLQATDLGLATCIMGWFDEPKIKALLNVPRQRRVALLVAVGYAPENEPIRKKIRKDVDAIRSYNGY